MGRWNRFFKICLTFTMLIIDLNVLPIIVDANADVEIEGLEEEEIMDFDPELDMDVELEMDDDGYGEPDDEIINDETEWFAEDEMEETDQLPEPFNAGPGDGLVQFELHPVGPLPSGVTQEQARAALMNTTTVTHPLFANATTTALATAINGAFGRDALFLGTSADGNRYRVLIAGFEGYVSRTGEETHHVTVSINGQNHQLTVLANAVFVPFGHDGTARHFPAAIETNLPEMLFSYQTLEYTSEDLEAESRIGISGHHEATVQSLSHYVNRNGELWRVLTNNVITPTGGAQFLTGPAPSWMSQNTRYYSFDGVYFYRNPRNIRVDGSGAVNADDPHFNYFQYLSFRSASRVTSTQLNHFLHTELGTEANRTDSVLTGQGQYFINAQIRYGINALLQYSKAMLESGRGLSEIARNNNNIFGLNAIDAAPGQNASVFPSVAASINDHANGWMSRGYLWPGDWRYEGPHAGHKASGMNVRYATDPYWGQKIAGWAFRIDRTLNNQDRNREQIVIRQNTAYVAVRDGEGTMLYTANPRQNRYFPFLVRGITENHLRIATDPAIVNGVANRTALFDRTTSIGYVTHSNVWQAGADTPAPVYTVTIEDGTGGGVFAEGDTVTINATVSTGERFVRWESVTTPVVNFANESSANTTFVMPSSNVTVRAVFEPISPQTHRVTVIGGTVTGGANHSVGTTVSIRANAPNAGYRFDRWTTNTQGVTFANARNATTTLTMPGRDTTVTAVFVRQIAANPTVNVRRPGIIRNNNVALHRGPGSAYHLNRRLSRGQQITVSNNGRNGWRFVQIGTGSVRGWVQTSQITETRSFGIVTGNNVPMRAGANSGATLNRLNRNTSITILGTNANRSWTQVRASSRTGWVRTNQIRTITRPGRTTRRIALRQGPGTNFKTIRTLSRNTNLQILGRQGNWMRVRRGNQTGWVQTNAARTTTPAARTRRQIQLRQGPGNSFARISNSRVNRNTRITVLARQGNWSRIRVGNRTGWVRTNQLR